MNDIDIERIKSKFYNKLMEEQHLKNKKTNLTSIILIAAVVSLTGATVFAVNLGVFDTIFRNFKDVSKIIQSANIKSKSSGITMELSSYLADTKGMIPQLVFTKDDGSKFAHDIVAVGSDNYRDIEYPFVKINNIKRYNISPKNIVSDDGKTYYCLPIIHYDIEKIINTSLEVSVNKLIYNVKEQDEIINFDLYNAYKKADVKTFNDIDAHSNWTKLFDNVDENTVQTKDASTIEAIVFANVIQMPKDMDIHSGMPPADGVDLASIYSHRPNHIIGIKYTSAIIEDDTECYFRPDNLLNNNDPFGIGIEIDSNTWYHFFRVNDFEDLKNMNGFIFDVTRNNYIRGKWHINTNFAANQDLNTVAINKNFNIDSLDTTLTLTKADISLLSTKLSYEVRDKEGNKLESISGYDMNTYYLKIISENEIKLLYSDASEINFVDFSFTSNPDGTINLSYNVEMNPDNYSLMNTNKLTAIVVNGESYRIN